MITAGELLPKADAQNVGLLFVVGEEADSPKTANELDVGSEYIFVGEPTENRMVSGHRGAFEFVIRGVTGAAPAILAPATGAVERLHGAFFEKGVPEDIFAHVDRGAYP